MQHFKELHAPVFLDAFFLFVGCDGWIYLSGVNIINNHTNNNNNNNYKNTILCLIQKKYFFEFFILSIFNFSSAVREQWRPCLGYTFHYIHKI